jgi:hypothetical protein
MLLSESAVVTLERNSPSGLLESMFEGDSFSTWARSFFAAAVSPDLMSDIRLVSALSKEFPLLLLELVVDDVEDVASSVKSELVLCKLEICMNCPPSHLDSSEIQLPKQRIPDLSERTAIPWLFELNAVQRKQTNPRKESQTNAVLKWEDLQFQRARSSG